MNLRPVIYSYQKVFHTNYKQVTYRLLPMLVEVYHVASGALWAEP